MDTSAWIAFFSGRDQNHGEADRLFREAFSRKALLTTTNLVLAELHRLILHRAGAGAAAIALSRICSSAGASIVFASRAHHDAAMAWLAKLRNHRVSYTDAVGFAVLEETRCIGFLGFDSDFLLAGFDAWVPR